MRRTAFGLASGILFVLAGPALAIDEVIDLLMYRDPEIPMAKRVTVYQKGLVQLWVEALDRPDADTRTQAATAIAHAKKRGVPGLEIVVPALKRELERDGQHPVVLLAVAEATVALDVKDVAPRFLALAPTATPELVEVITPALAAWDYRPARADWRARIDSPNTRHRSTLLAMRALATVKDEVAADRLRALALSPDESGPVRLEAARALSDIRPAGLEADARKLVPEKSERKGIDRLVAVTLVRRHSGEAAVAVLQAFARDPEPSVAAIALGRLIELDPNHVLPMLTAVLGSADANVRALGVTVLDMLPKDDHLTKLADSTNDPHPAIRVQARKALHGHAGKGLLARVAQEATRILAGSNWRGQEQAAILLAQLDHKAAAPRLVELLAGDRGETIAAVAWAVRKLDVPEVLPAVHNYVRGLLPVFKDRGDTISRKAAQASDVDMHVYQLVHFLGQRRYRPAAPVLKEFLPPVFRGRMPTPIGFESRTAAIWALGLIHEGVPDRELTALFVGRLSAVMPGDVEDGRVRAMSAISLARMKSQSAVKTLRQFYADKQPTVDLVNNSCGWALEQLTGEKMPPAGVVEGFDLDWFLKPAR